MSHKIVKELIDPQSIVIIGGSNNVHKPGGKILKNILNGNYKGELHVVNPKEEIVQGVKSFHSADDLPDTDLAILAIPSKLCPETVRTLSEKKNTKAFIIISAGFSEENGEGQKLEDEIVEIVEEAGGTLIGPNCIGVMTPAYNGVFTLPIPKLHDKGCDFISGSGATAVFIMESGIPKGLSFSRVFSIGNSAQTGVEEMLEYMDETFDEELSSKVKVLYIENIKNPQKLLKHSSSLIKKGCKIAAIKSGSSDAGSRAASSHTGAIASSDLAVDALFRKAGIVRCHGREELSTMAAVMMHPEVKGKNIAIITHAGGPAIMLTDVLSKGGLDVPSLDGDIADELLTHLNPGSSVSNPIDVVATGTAEQLGIALDFCETRFKEIDAIIVIFGTSGLTEVFDAYDALHKKMLTAKKPIFPVLPSVVTAAKEIESFLEYGRINFHDEVILGSALTKFINRPKPAEEEIFTDGIDIPKIREIIENADSGYITEYEIQSLLDAAGIKRVKGGVCNNEEDLIEIAHDAGYPLVMKVQGPLHKSDVGGVSLNIDSDEYLLSEFNRMEKIEGYTSVLVQPMLSGIELFLGASYDEKFGHTVLCGLGGIFVEVIKDVSSGLVPLSREEALTMIRSLKSYKIIEGLRGQEGVNENVFAEIIIRLSTLLQNSPEIKEMDLNPLMGLGDNITVVDARIRIDKN